MIRAVQCLADKCEESLNGRIPLKKTTKEDFLKCTMLLINAGADVNAINQNCDTALHAASTSGNFGCVRELLAAGADLKKKNICGDTPATLAAGNGHDKVLNLLLKAGVSDKEINLCLLSAAKKAAHNKICIDLLLKAGADVNVRNSIGETPLFLASRNRYSSSEHALRLLINAGADVNAIDRDRNTVLHFAASFDFLNTLKPLLLAGVHVNKRNNAGETALQKCLTPTPILPQEFYSYHGCLNLVEVLFAAGDSFNLNERKTHDRQSISKLKKMMVPRMSLKDMCRHKIRNHLMSIDSHLNLFVRVPKLGLPHILASYVLFNQDEASF